MDNSKVGHFIQELRKERNLTQAQLSELVHVDRSAVSKWERGTNIPDPTCLMILSIAFNVSVNELLSGERVNEENKERIENTALTIMEESNRQIKKIRRGLNIFIIIVLFLFLAYYFFNNYSSIKVYLAYAEGKTYTLNQSIIVVSKQKYYLKLGNITSANNEKIKSISVYYKDKGNKHEIISTDELSSIYVDYFGYDELIDYSNIKNVVNNLYIDITGEAGTEVIKFNTELDLTNNVIGTLPLPKNTEKRLNINNTVPKYIKDNWNYKSDSYHKTYDYKGNKYDCIYNIEGNFISISNASLIGLIDYDIAHNKINITMDEENVIYDYDNKKCISANCKKVQGVIDFVQENIVKNLD